MLGQNTKDHKQTAPGGLNGHGGKQRYCGKCGHSILQKQGTYDGVGCLYFWDGENPDGEYIDRFCPGGCGTNIYNNPPIADQTTRVLVNVIEKMTADEKTALLNEAARIVEARVAADQPALQIVNGGHHE